MTHQSQLPALLSAAQVAAMLGISIRKLYGLKSAGEIPRAVSLGSKRCVRWRRTDIDKWIARLS